MENGRPIEVRSLCEGSFKIFRSPQRLLSSRRDEKGDCSPRRTFRLNGCFVNRSGIPSDASIPSSIATRVLQHADSKRHRSRRRREHHAKAEPLPSSVDAGEPRTRLSNREAAQLSLGLAARVDCGEQNTRYCQLDLEVSCVLFATPECEARSFTTDTPYNFRYN
eukprot:6190296-Pleurochrysis_carterae.AAC.3